MLYRWTFRDALFSIIHIAAVESAFCVACATGAVGMSLSSHLPVDLLSERAIEIEGGAD
jgi:hypothetical protein